VATGHTRDDQAETVLLNLSRHAGRTRGGIRSRRPDGLVRPLLPFGRVELRAWLDAAGVAYREDETNSDTRFARNRIRSEILPGLEQRFPGVTERLARAGDALAARLSALDSALDERLATSGLGVEGPWPRSLFRDLAPEAAARLLVRALGSAGRVPGGVQLREALASLRGSRGDLRALLGGRRLLADGRAVRLLPP
jgi:tRNA(Ile)-lysidine synthase